MILRLLAWFWMIALATELQAQTSPTLSSSQIELGLNKLNVLGSVLYVAAHPDDENTRLLAYLANEKHYRTGYLSLTRGDGGQNLIGNEQGELLGLIRTQELLAARRTDGAEQFFTRANDFGYSKNPEEAFSIWGKENILADVVFVIRQFQPDVIICRFPTTGEGGHGHHTASAIIAQEAFTAAADPNRFPDQLKYVNVWQAKRLLWNTFNFGGTNTTSEDQFKIEVGGNNYLLGKSYGEIAAESRTNHKSQGFGSAKTRGSQLEYFKTILGDPPQHDLMDGIATGWDRVPNSSAIQSMVNSINSAYNPSSPSNSVAALLGLHAALESSKEGFWKKLKLKETDDLIAACAGLWFEAYGLENLYSPGEKIQWKIQAINRSDVPVNLTHVAVQDFDTMLNTELGNNKLLSYQHQQILQTSTNISQPYWLQHPHDAGTFKIPDQELVGRPENTPPVSAKFTFSIAGTNLEFSRPLVYKSTDPVRGEVYQPLEIAPTVMINIEAPVYVLTGTQHAQIKVTVRSASDSIHGTVMLKRLPGWNIDPSAATFNLIKKADEQSFTFSVWPSSPILHSSVDTLAAVATVSGKTYDQSYRAIDYNHIPAITLFPPAKAKLVSIPLKKTGSAIGYINGAGDLVPEMLRQIGYNVTMLSAEQVASGNLGQYDAIIMGVRAYNTDEWLKFSNDKLKEYVRNGGTLVTQYNTTADLIMENVGPYPFKITRDRVTDETAKVTFINPGDPLLNAPNKITDQDFNGWIQERGLYFLNDIDTLYQKILLMNDPGEKPLDGSLIATRYGKGKFIYTSLSFFRELPAGVPGAYRLFVNLISKNE